MSLARCAPRGVWLAAVIVALSWLAAPVAQADGRTDYLLNMLRTSSLFRVRTQAAISLADVETEPSVLAGLTRALDDDHPAVRAAAARSLERHGDPSVLAALRRHQEDAEAAVRSAVASAIAALERVDSGGGGGGAVDARFYLGVATPSARDPRLDERMLTQVRTFIVSQAQALGDTLVAPADESPRAAGQAIRQRGLVGYFLDCSVSGVSETAGGGLRVDVICSLQTYPGRNIRGNIRGNATVMGGGNSPALLRAVVQGAFQGALRSLHPAMEAAAGSR